MHVFGVLSVLLIVTSALANKTDVEKPEAETDVKNIKFQELEAIANPSEDKEVKRSKKSTTTTFCVEIRPSGPFQKPFQVCEPAEPEKPIQPAPSQAYSAPPAAPTYYSATNYGMQEQPKPQPAYQAAAAYKPPSQPKAGAVYAAPVKTYSPPTTQAPKQYAAHGMSYSSYRKGEESGTEEHGHLMMHRGSAEEDNESEMEDEMQLRSSGYGSSSYGSSSYGSPTSYLPVVPKKHGKHPNHNGLVITCQPNLAGYAHNVPSSLHHPPAVPSYSYRPAAPAEYGSKYGRYQVQSHSYGTYPQLPLYKSSSNGYKSQSTVHHSASSLSGPSKATYGVTSYGPQEPAYNPPSYKSPPAAIYSPPPRQQVLPSYAVPPSAAYSPPTAPVQPAAPAYAHQPTHPQAAHFSQNYAHTPAYNPAPAPIQYAPAPAPAPAYAPTPTAPSGYASAPVLPLVPTSAAAQSAASFSQTQTFSSNLPMPGPPPPPAPQAQSYASPGTYRDVNEEGRMQAKPPADSGLQDEKEKQTLKKMGEISHQRAAGSKFVAEMASEKSKNNQNDKLGQGAHQGWSPNMITDDKTGSLKTGSELQKHESENEVE